ncbi:MAG: radical SAM protein, partial [Eubacteriales bacterium]|nr:radical SAM protein [Eubacteriales bacterium]
RHINYHFTLLGEISDYLNNVFDNNVEVIDLDAENIDLGQFIKKIINFDITGVAILVSPENLSHSIKVAKILKQIYPKTKIIAYGHLAELLPNIFSKYDSFDAVHVNGDQETAIEKFFLYVSKKIKLEELSGINLLEKGKIIKTAKGEFLSEEKWGFTRINKLPVQDYCKIKEANRVIINLTRGCPFSCPHCLVHIIQGNKVRYRPIEKVKEYLQTIYPRFTHIKLWAANFTLNKKYVNDFCKMISENFPYLTWECATRVDLIDDEELIKKMKLSGCRQITLGIESIEEEDLSNINKNYNLKNLKKVIKLMQSNNMVIKACIMLGMPNQTKSSIIKTLDFLNDLKLKIRPTIYTPYQEMNENLSVEEIEMFNRKLFYVENKEITYRQYLQLLYNLNDYKNILK